MSKTQYLPAEWLDETVPTPVDHPDQLLHISDGKWFMVASEEEEDETWKTELQHGSFVEFCEFRDHGHWTVTVRQDADGGLVIEGDAGIPAEANCFYADGDTDTFSEDLNSMFEGMHHSDPDLSGNFRVHAYHWSEGKPWYFAEVDDGACFSEPGTFGSEAVH